MPQCGDQITSTQASQTLGFFMPGEGIYGKVETSVAPPASVRISSGPPSTVGAPCAHPENRERAILDG